jgi:hypothetical protein
MAFASPRSASDCTRDNISAGVLGVGAGAAAAAKAGDDDKITAAAQISKKNNFSPRER